MRAKWFLLVGAAGLWAASVLADDQKEAPKPVDSYVKIGIVVELKGTLAHTPKGTFVTAQEQTEGPFTTKPKGEIMTWELDLSKVEDLQALARKLNGKTVVVAGTAELRKTRVAAPTGFGFGGGQFGLGGGFGAQLGQFGLGGFGGQLGLGGGFSRTHVAGPMAVYDKWEPVRTLTATSLKAAEEE